MTDSNLQAHDHGRNSHSFLFQVGGLADFKTFSNDIYWTRDIPFKRTKELNKLEKMKADNIQYFEDNYENLIYTTRSTDWSDNFERKLESDTLYPYFMSNLNSRMKVNLRRKTQKLCSNKVSAYNLQTYERILLGVVHKLH